MSEVETRAGTSEVGVRYGDDGVSREEASHSVRGGGASKEEVRHKRGGCKLDLQLELHLPYFIVHSPK
jgi:hypothetical protein